MSDCKQSVIRDADVIEIDGKQWKPVAFGVPADGQYFVSSGGDIACCPPCCLFSERLIVEPFIPEWITPTDEHAKQRPVVHVRDDERHDWESRRLVYVDDNIGRQLRFTVANSAGMVSSWKYCRMRNPLLDPQNHAAPNTVLAG